MNDAALPSLPASLVEILRCPLTGQRLALVGRDRLAALGIDGEAALVREDGLVCYPLDHGFPNLLPDRALAVPGRLDPPTAERVVAI